MLLMKLFFIVSSKPVKSKVACKPVFDVPSKPVKSNIARTPDTNVSNKLVKSKFTSKPVSSVPSNVLHKLISKATHKLSNSFVSESASLVSGSLDSSLTLANL